MYRDGGINKTADGGRNIQLGDMAANRPGVANQSLQLSDDFVSDPDVVHVNGETEGAPRVGDFPPFGDRH
ncbi:hypothetical protein D3C75_1371090 [compost metagenome]